MCNHYQLFDSHCHLDFDAFNSDIAHHVSIAKKSGVVGYLLPSIGEQNWEQVATISYAYPEQLVYALGFHPYFLANPPDEKSWERLEQMIRESDRQCVAVGECGLDFVVPVDHVLQKKVFERQVHLAEQYELPLILHSRKSQSDIIRVLKQTKFSYGGILHGFSGSQQQAEAFIDLGFKIGVGGVITYPRANKTRTAISRLPVESLVLETDAPDMPIYGYQGESNHPKRLPLILAELAVLTGLQESELANQLMINTLSVLNLDQ